MVPTDQPKDRICDVLQCADESNHAHELAPAPPSPHCDSSRRWACEVELSLWPWSPSAAARAGLVVNARSSGKSCGGTALKRRRWRVAELGFMTTRGVCSTWLATELAPRRSVRAGHTTPRPRAEEAPSVLPEQPEASCRRARPPATSPVIAESCGETGRPAALAVSPDGSIQPLDVESIIASWTSMSHIVRLASTWR